MENLTRIISITNLILETYVTTMVDLPSNVQETMLSLYAFHLINYRIDDEDRMSLLKKKYWNLRTSYQLKAFHDLRDLVTDCEMLIYRWKLNVKLSDFCYSIYKAIKAIEEGDALQRDNDRYRHWGVYDIETSQYHPMTKESTPSEHMEHSSSSHYQVLKANLYVLQCYYGFINSLIYFFLKTLLPLPFNKTTIIKSDTDIHRYYKEKTNFLLKKKNMFSKEIHVYRRHTLSSSSSESSGRPISFFQTPFIVSYTQFLLNHLPRDIITTLTKSLIPSLDVSRDLSTLLTISSTIIPVKIMKSVHPPPPSHKSETVPSSVVVSLSEKTIITSLMKDSHENDMDEDTMNLFHKYFQHPSNNRYVFEDVGDNEDDDEDDKEEF